MARWGEKSTAKAPFETMALPCADGGALGNRFAGETPALRQATAGAAAKVCCARARSRFLVRPNAASLGMTILVGLSDLGKGYDVMRAGRLAFPGAGLGDGDDVDDHQQGHAERRN